jgi:hypothetical protein
LHTIVTQFIGIIFVSVSGFIQHKIVGEDVIDDTGLASSTQSSTKLMLTKQKDLLPDETVLFDKMQKMLQFFLEFLQVPGGDLNISKCAYFKVFHRWIGGRASLLEIQDFHPLMTSTHPHYGEIRNIDKKVPDQSHRALVGMMTTYCKSTAQFIVLKRKAKLFVGAILQS